MVSASSPYSLPPGTMPPRSLGFAEAVTVRRCQLCWRAGAELVRVRVIRRADGCRARALVCGSCLSYELDQRPDITWLRVIPGSPER